MRGLEEQDGFADDSRKENPRYGFQSAYRLSYASYYNPNAPCPHFSFWILERSLYICGKCFFLQRNELQQGASAI